MLLNFLHSSLINFIHYINNNGALYPSKDMKVSAFQGTNTELLSLNSGCKNERDATSDILLFTILAPHGGKCCKHQVDILVR
jgi:hypothetical protein